MQQKSTTPASLVLSRPCAQCGTLFTPLQKNVARGGGLYCSRPCQSAGSRVAVEDSRSYAPARPCEHCGTLFSPRIRYLEMGYGRFCSQRCGRRARMLPVEERFWALVDKNGPLPPVCPELGCCWPWTGWCEPHGYGVFVPDGRKILAHRYSYALLELIPAGLWVLHRCDNPPCVKPTHLYVGTPANNSLDMVEHGHSTRGERNTRAKLSAAAVAGIRVQIASGAMTAAQLAVEYSVHRNTIERIARGQTWREEDHQVPRPPQTGGYAA